VALDHFCITDLALIMWQVEGENRDKWMKGCVEFREKTTTKSQ